MRIIFTIVLFFNIAVYANLIKQQDFYDNGEYKKCIEEAKNSINDSSSYKQHLLWAKSAEALCEEDEAMSAYERVLMLDEDNIEAMVALVNLYRYTDREELEKEMLEKLEGRELSAEQKRSLKRSANRSIYSLNTSLSLAVGHDSNINSSPDSAVMDDYIGFRGSDGELSTIFSRFSGKVSYKNELKTKGGWYTKAEMRAFYQKNLDQEFYNIFVGSVEGGLGYVGDRFSLYIPAGYDYIHYLEKDLLNTYKLNPNITTPLAKSLILNVNLLLANREYIEVSDKTKNDRTTALGLTLYYLVGENFVYFNTKYEDIRASQSNPASFINKKIISASLGTRYKLLPKTTGKIDYRYKHGKYEELSRTDNYHQIEFKLSYLLSRKTDLYVSERYAQNFSNYVPAEYNKNVVMFGLGLNY